MNHGDEDGSILIRRVACRPLRQKRARSDRHVGDVLDANRERYAFHVICRCLCRRTSLLYFLPSCDQPVNEKLGWSGFVVGFCLGQKTDDASLHFNPNYQRRMMGDSLHTRVLLSSVF